MEITINGNAYQVSSNVSLLTVLKEYSLAEKTGTAIAVNDAVVLKGKWAETILSEGDKILIITATKGG